MSQVNEETKARIEQALTRIESEHGVRILYAAESGSRAWGFASPDSDWDVRFLYIRPLTDYVRVDPLLDVIELPIEGDLDVNGWDLPKALGLFRKSNPTLIEWLHSPIVYREFGPFAARLRELARTHTSEKRMMYHYWSMALQNYRTNIDGRDEVSLKKYLYVLRPLACAMWLERHRVPPPTRFADTLDGVTLPDAVRLALDDLLLRKSATGEMGKAAPNAVLNAYIESELVRIEAVAPTLPDSRMEAEKLNEILWTELGLRSDPPRRFEGENQA